MSSETERHAFFVTRAKVITPLSHCATIIGSISLSALLYKGHRMKLDEKNIYDTYSNLAFNMCDNSSLDLAMRLRMSTKF